MDTVTFWSERVCIFLKEYLWRAGKLKPVCVSVNGWYGMSMTLHIYWGNAKAYAGLCVAPCYCHFPWVDSVVDRQDNSSGWALSLTQRALSEPPQLYICLSRVTLICFVLDHMFHTHCSPEMPILLLKPDAAFKCDCKEHLVMVNLQNNANNYFLGGLLN